jgi:Protein of unknown function (DUF4239)
MDLYWLYDLPNSVFFLITITVFITFSLLGSFLFSEKLEKKLNLKAEHNQIVSIFIGLASVFYGITLGLIAVGTFDNFNAVEDKVNNESSALAALYQDVSFLQNPENEKLKTILKQYTKYVITKAWPLQKKGIVPTGGTQIVNTFQSQLVSYIPQSEKDKIILSEILDQYNVFLENRRLRLNAVNSSLPATIWLVLFLGAMINIVLTWFLVINNKKLDILVNVLTGLLLGSLIFLIAAMDNPFRGEYCVTADSFQLLLDGIMNNK